MAAADRRLWPPITFQPEPPGPLAQVASVQRKEPSALSGRPVCRPDLRRRRALGVRSVNVGPGIQVIYNWIRAGSQKRRPGRLLKTTHFPPE
jgi:hypothetical protein